MECGNCLIGKISPFFRGTFFFHSADNFLVLAASLAQYDVHNLVTDNKNKL